MQQLVYVESGFMNDRPEGNGHENMCDDRSQNDLQTIYMYTQSQKTTGPKQKNK